MKGSKECYLLGQNTTCCSGASVLFCQSHQQLLFAHSTACCVLFWWIGFSLIYFFKPFMCMDLSRVMLVTVLKSDFSGKVPLGPIRLCVGVYNVRPFSTSSTTSSPSNCSSCCSLRRARASSKVLACSTAHAWKQGIQFSPSFVLKVLFPHGYWFSCGCAVFVCCTLSSKHTFTITLINPNSHTHACMHPHTCIHTHLTHTHASIHTSHTRMHPCTNHTRMHPYTHHTHACMHTHITCMHTHTTHMHACTHKRHTCIHTRTHTGMYTHIHPHPHNHELGKSVKVIGID